RTRVEINDAGCWIWQQSVNNKGYAIAKVAAKTQTVHRLVATLAFGPIPAGMQVDHRCAARNCVNPEHLEVVTPQINALRALARLGVSA
ncbi:MAG TPA: HNH endonuclease signature motif containing protein, partial [Acidimicrobiales bacterium]|nr:HNH endonuclease signature motif containing protein [Acidimicrobiales bacterium]